VDRQAGLETGSPSIEYNSIAISDVWNAVMPNPQKNLVVEPIIHGGLLKRSDFT
jgi:hypothetical protein